MLAIPVLRSRVAPVLNWCSTVRIYPDVAAEPLQGREITLGDVSGPERLRILKQEGVRTIICGALTRDLLTFGEGLGLHIIHGVAGEVVEVLQAYRTQSLDRPCYWLPGCRGSRRYRRAFSDGCPERGRAKVGQSEARRSGAAGAAAGRLGEGRKPGGGSAGPGPGGFCVCPNCGAAVPHEQGIPCSQVVCSRCDRPMVRG